MCCILSVLCTEDFLTENCLVTPVYHPPTSYESQKDIKEHCAVFTKWLVSFIILSCSNFLFNQILMLMLPLSNADNSSDGNMKQK